MGRRELEEAAGQGWRPGQGDLKLNLEDKQNIFELPKRSSGFYRKMSVFSLIVRGPGIFNF